MRWLILADVHANLDALDAVLADADARFGRLRVVCAGDMVGFGPNPMECLARLRARSALCVLGNHDMMVLGRMERMRCTPAGLHAVRWTRSKMEPEMWDWLGALPLVRPVADAFVLCHGSLEDVDRYVDHSQAVREQLALLVRQHPRHRVLVCGHTHRPTWAPGGDMREPAPGTKALLPSGECVLINPGSVGHSRTRDPLARWAVLDTEARTVAFYATEYDVRACARKIRTAGLHTSLYVTPAAQWAARGRRIAGRVRSWLRPKAQPARTA